MAYYYLVSQLPYLSYGQAAPMSSAEFRDLAKNSLEPNDAAWLDYCTLSPFGSITIKQTGQGDQSPYSLPGIPDFFLRWYEWERALRQNLARLRAGRLKRDFSADAPEYPADAVMAAKAAVNMDSPLEAEIFLDQARWNAVEIFQGYNYFERNTIYAYLLKLLLLERRSFFKTEEGFAEYKGLYAAVMKAADQRAAG